jgi:hypothetical protein
MTLSDARVRGVIPAGVNVDRPWGQNPLRPPQRGSDQRKQFRKALLADVRACLLLPLLAAKEALQLGRELVA